MVATLFTLRDVASTLAYHEADDYYTGDAKGMSAWLGRGARKLGLRGEVEPETFAPVLKGHLPNGTKLGTWRKGEWQHRPGFDLTFSAPKSASIMALVSGDRRIVEAHDRAVMAALDFGERHIAATRIHVAGSTKEKIATNNFTAAAFSHFTARPTTTEPPSPQLHTHLILTNATQADDGVWRSLDSHPIYQAQKQLGAIYHQHFAADLLRIGYTLEIAPDGTFEIEGVGDDVRAAFSARKRDIDSALALRGKDRATATAAERQIATFDTRLGKESVDHAELTSTWRERANRLGFDERVRRGLVAEAEARTRTRPASSARARSVAADRAVAYAAEKLGGRDSVFSAGLLEVEAGIASRGAAFPADIAAAVVRAERREELVIRPAPGAPTGTMGFTTLSAIETESRMLSYAIQGREAFTPLQDAERAKTTVNRTAKTGGHKWTTDQRRALEGLLRSRSATTIIQGAAGTAKTTTVIKNYADAARADGLIVRPFAPTSAAARVLGKAVGEEHQTVARLLVGDTADHVVDGEVWIIDESSMLSAHDQERVLARAHEVQARVILVGDTQQIGSVGAGRAFKQLQQAGVLTFRLAEIVRQTNGDLRRAVEAMIVGDHTGAFDALDEGGGAVIQHPEADVRRALMARDFAALPPKERASTLVIDPTREGRRLLSDAIRVALARRGDLGRTAILASTLELRDMARSERTVASNYLVGETVVFRRSNTDLRIAASTLYRITAIDHEAGSVALADTGGRSVTWHPARWGSADAEALVEVEQEFRAGDRVQFTANNLRAGRDNGATATVESVDPHRLAMTITMADGEIQRLDLTRLADRRIRSGWVQTAHAAQGATSERVMAHLESFRANIVNAPLVYVALSRARKHAAVYTEDRDGLIEALDERIGINSTALPADFAMSPADAAAIGI